jgi:hypothetical protein
LSSVKVCIPLSVLLNQAILNVVFCLFLNL